uniref:Choline transporter-like protein n=1 Tax=Hemiselmis andersenii TaxID=464988 RepID=A0A6U4I244_HEMAN
MGGAASKREDPEDHAELQEKIKKNGGTPLPQGDMVMLPWEQRGCTDCLMLMIFIAFIGAMIAVGVIGFANGNPLRLHYGYDFNGHVCGTGVNSGKQNLYYPFPFPGPDPGGLPGSIGTDFTNVDLSWAVCVEKCPNQVSVFPPNQCMQAFQSRTDAGGVVTCGGNEDLSTDMSQFVIGKRLPTSASNVNSDTVDYGLDSQGPFGYQKYCLERVPVCSPCGDETCCDGTNQGGDGASTRNITSDSANPSQVFYGISLGRKYGFCYVPIPTIKAKYLTRCLPYSGTLAEQVDVNGNVIDATQSLNSGLAAYSSANRSNTVSNEQLSSATAVVATVVGGPQDTFASLADEINTHKWIILACAGIALGVALIYSQILRVAAIPLVSSVLVAIWVLLAGSTAILCFKAGVIETSQLPLELDGAVSSIPLPEGVTLGQSETNLELLIIACVVVGVTFLIYTVMLCFMASRIYLACKVIQQAGACLAEIPSALLFPLVQWIFMIALFIWFIVVFLYLASAGDWDMETRTYVWNDTVRRAIIFHFFGLLWVRAFILAVGNLVIAGATCDWFIINDKKLLRLPVYSAFLRTLRFHLGTAAAGSLIIAIVQFIRWVFRYYMYQLSKFSKDNPIVKVLACIGECCLACLERFLKFINRNAYIQTAMVGTSFCTSAREATVLIIRNCMRVGALAAVATIFNNFGKLFIAVVTGLLGALIIQGGDLDSISDAPIFSVTIIVILAFGVASAFIDVWDVVVESLFQCFCMDIEKGSGKAGGDLKQFMAENEGKGASKREIASQI